MGIHLPPPPHPEPSALREWVLAIRAVLAAAPFPTLDTLGESLRPPRPRQRLSEIARGTRLPEVHELRDLVRVCRCAAEGPRLVGLLQAAVAERAAQAAAPVAPLVDYAVTGSARNRLPLVGEFRDWTRLGVHRPITRLQSGEDLAARVDAGELPSYVLREADIEAGTGLRPLLASATVGSSVHLVLITGESSAGKTRAAVEAMRVHLSRWRLLIPHSATRLELLLDQHLDLRRVVVWLDEVQDFLREPHGTEQLERLLANRSGPTVLLATLRTDAENMLRGTSGWRLLDSRAHRVTLPRRPRQSEIERELARVREWDDPWIAEALAKIGDRYGIAEWLSAGPQLLRELKRVRTCSDPIELTAAAIVDAAIDSYRAGYTTPIPKPLLAEAHRLYLPEHLTHVDPPGVFEEALRWARRPVAGASALLEQAPRCGDKAFDYLHSEATQPGYEPIDRRIWNILLRQATPQTLITIGHAAAREAQANVVQVCLGRVEEEQAADLLRRIGAREELARRAGGPREEPPLLRGYRDELAALLAEQGEIEELTRRADEGDWPSCKELARLLVEREDYDELRRRAAQGDLPAKNALLDQLVTAGNVAELTRLAPSGLHAHLCLITLLEQLGDVAGLARLADSGDDMAANTLSWILKKQGNEDELARRAAAGDEDATERLAWLRIERMSESELRSTWEAGDPRGADAYAQLLFSRGDETGLAELADAKLGHSWLARWRLAELLYQHGDRRKLAKRADSGDRDAAKKLAQLLAECGDEDELARRVAGGNWHAEIELDKLLAARGQRRA